MFPQYTSTYTMRLPAYEVFCIFCIFRKMVPCNSLVQYLAILEIEKVRIYKWSFLLHTEKNTCTPCCKDIVLTISRKHLGSHLLRYSFWSISKQTEKLLEILNSKKKNAKSSHSKEFLMKLVIQRRRIFHWRIFFHKAQRVELQMQNTMRTKDKF